MKDGFWILIAALVGLVFIVRPLMGQEVRYLRCESPEDIQFYADIRADLPESFVEDWVAWNEACEWTGPSIPYETDDGEVFPGGSVTEIMETDDPEILRIWLWGEGTRYALRSALLR